MSAAYIRVLTPDGLKAVDYTAASLTDASQYEPDDGIYTVTNTYNTFQTLKFDAHLDRMEDSAQRSDISLKLDRPRLKATLRAMIADADMGDVRFRITVSRAQPDQFIITLEPYNPPAKTLIEDGARVMTVPNSARHDASAKTTDWMHQRKAISAAMPDGIYDAILLDADGYMMEGLGANFYAIHEGVLRTASEGMLPGIAQQIVFEVAPAILQIEKKPVHQDDITDLQESFITSSSRGIIPVVEIDGHQLGDGTPGPLTQQLRAAYIAWVDDHLEDL